VNFFDSFVDILWWTFGILVMVAYFFVLFRIIMDIFRDRELGGFAKAIWLIALIFLPLITALIYVIARGKGMAQRDIEAMEEYRAAQVEYTQGLMKDAAKPATPADQIAQAKALLESGAISEEEFDKLKAKALV
jgi:ABC-type multidrug transport system fused ATPase/permease subunit